MIMFKELSSLDLRRDEEKKKGGWIEKSESRLVLCLHRGAPEEAAVN